ncbi:MAG: DNA primase [Deltaproteobacteria bacterium]|nr:DNA primase [Deltaproteobacteria bacterium]
MSAHPRLDAALSYAASEWPVFPLWWPVNGRCACGKPDCQHPAKHPLGTLAPHGVKDATTDSQTIRLWWGRAPLANIGIATGPESGLVVVDLDPRNGGQPDRLPGPLPTTPTARTGGGGWHYYLAHPGDGLKFPPKLPGCPGADIKGGGGYVLAPPSLHVSGRRYSWDTPPTHILAPCPDWLLNAAKRPDPNPTVTPPAVHVGNHGTAYGRAALRAELTRLAQAPEGDRNNALNRAGYSLGRLVAAGHLPGDTVRGLLATVAEKAGLLPQEVERTLRSGMNAGREVHHA